MTPGEVVRQESPALTKDLSKSKLAGAKSHGVCVLRAGGSMRFRFVSDGQAGPGAASISRARDLSELRCGSIELAAVLRSARGLEQMQLAGDATAGPSRKDAIYLSQWPPLVALNVHRPHFFSRVRALPWSQDTDSTDSRRRC